MCGEAAQDLVSKRSYTVVMMDGSNLKSEGPSVLALLGKTLLLTHAATDGSCWQRLRRLHTSRKRVTDQDSPSLIQCVVYDSPQVFLFDAIPHVNAPNIIPEAPRLWAQLTCAYTDIQMRGR